jgi:hypothetical protein
MKIKTLNNTHQKYLILKENESIILLAENEIKSSVHILCKNKKLFIEMGKKIKKDQK